MQNKAIKSFCQMDSKTAKKKLKQAYKEAIGKGIADGKPTIIISDPDLDLSIGCMIACFDEGNMRKIKNI